MDFKIFQENCKYREYALKPNTVREAELVCHNPSNIPSGCSWTKCNRNNCPKFNYGFKINNVTAIDIKTGEVLFTLDALK